MRRTMLALTAGFALALTAACNTNTPAATPSAAESKSPSPSASPNTKEVCSQIETKMETMMTTIGTAVGTWIGFNEAGAKAQAEAAKKEATAAIVKEADALAALAGTATDPKVKADIQKVADSMKASSDLKFLEGVKIADFEAPFTKEVTAWALPLAMTCNLK
ncbi:hypothetical protein [Catelliglobosispora koreensis]|uniref:hypothetical protein n=1 Tax=Catelliglobosispora koreensis TaxID=129052 RepID=UPI0003622E78|nr:hypothetical protein [Catelliglobosispora koreensis]